MLFSSRVLTGQRQGAPGLRQGDAARGTVYHRGLTLTATNQVFVLSPANPPFVRGGGASSCILEIFAEKRVSNHPDLLLIGQACRAAQPPPIFELVRNTLHHGDTIETRV
jgi:hypothetical protein